MPKTHLTLAAAAFLLVGGIAVSHAQQSPSGTTAPQQGHDAGHQGTQPETSGAPGMMGRGSGMMGQGSGMMDSDGRGRHGGGPGRMGPDMMTMMMMIMIDTNGDGALSLEEVQAVHARIFKYADTDKDGQLTLEELRGFMHGGAGSR